MGIATTLILVILLTQSRLFDFLTETPLGRMVLLAFIIFISYTNHILGLLAVLVIIIAFNQHDMNIYEGLKMPKINTPKINMPEEDDEDEDDEDDEEEDTKDKKKIRRYKGPRRNGPRRNGPRRYRPKGNAKVDSKEGFCMAEKELTMLRGKQSNSIPVFNKSREQEEGVSPSDKSIFKNLFSEF
jgi:hypothetical protein